MRTPRPRQLAIALVLAAVVYVLLLLFPQPLFAYELEHAGIVVHSTQPIPDAMRGILERVRGRLATSPLVSPSDRYNVFICHPRWLFAFFARMNYQVGGIAQPHLGGHVFLRESDIRNDRLISPRGIAVAADRPLSYFLAHETLHIAEGRAISAAAYWRLPTWVKDGYADYVARDIDLGRALADFKAGARDLDPARSGLYLRYHLMVAYVLDKRGMDVASLLHAPPDAGWVEEQLSALSAW